MSSGILGAQFPHSGVQMDGFRLMQAVIWTLLPGTWHTNLPASKSTASVGKTGLWPVGWHQSSKLPENPALDRKFGCNLFQVSATASLVQYSVLRDAWQVARDALKWSSLSVYRLVTVHVEGKRCSSGEKEPIRRPRGRMVPTKSCTCALWYLLASKHALPLMLSSWFIYQDTWHCYQDTWHLLSKAMLNSHSPLCAPRLCPSICYCICVIDKKLPV